MMTVAHPPAPDDHPVVYFPAQSSSATQAQQYQMENQRRLHGAESPGTPEADAHAPHPLSAKDVGLDPLAISPKGQAPISGAGLPSERHDPQPDEAQPVEQTTGMPGSFPEDQEYVLHSLVSCPLVTDPQQQRVPGAFLRPCCSFCHFRHPSSPFHPHAPSSPRVTHPARAQCHFACPTLPGSAVPGGCVCELVANAQCGFPPSRILDGLRPGQPTFLAS